MSTEAKPQDDLTQRLCRFAQWVLTHGPWIGCDVDGGDAQDKALELGITIKRVATEADCIAPGKCTEYLMPGDDYFELTPEIMSILGITP